MTHIKSVSVLLWEESVDELELGIAVLVDPFVVVHRFTVPLRHLSICNIFRSNLFLESKQYAKSTSVYKR